jgi:hypothetical protein
MKVRSDTVCTDLLGGKLETKKSAIDQKQIEKRNNLIFKAKCTEICGT